MARQKLFRLNFRDFFVILIFISGFFVLPTKPLLADEEDDEPEIVTIAQSANLTRDIYGSVVIQADNLTLDCQGHRIIGSGPDSGDGVYLEGRYQVVIKNCLIENFNVGIDLQCSSQNQIFENTVANNGLGININCYCAASDNVVYHNNFKNNGEQARLINGDNDLFDNSYPEGGNYWSDYGGSDANGDGIGDESYVFSGGEDHYPFMKENGWKEETPEWRRNILAGDILYDPFASGVGHTGLYVGDSWVAEALGVLPGQNGYPGEVKRSPITDWDYPQRDTVYLLRVKRPDGISDEDWNQKKQTAIDFAYQQYNKPYDWHWYQKQYDINSPSWYCSELVWAAYYNQGVDLEYRTDGVVFDLIDPVSPVEIFDDDDTIIIGSHLEGLNSTPWYRRFASLMVLSPVNVVVTDRFGNTIDQSGVNIPGATFIENQTDASGHQYDIFYLPVEYGPYQIQVARKPDARDEDVYGLKTQTKSGDVWLAQDQLVPAENEKDEYNFDPAALNDDNDDPAAGGFNDTEESSGNSCQAGTLDGRVDYASPFDAAEMMPGDQASQNTTFFNEGSLDFKYKIKYEKTGGDAEFCGALLLTAERNGTKIYDRQLLKNFDLDNFSGTPFSIAASGKDDWDFTLELPADAGKDLEKKSCEFNFNFTGWQTDFADNTQGWSDTETIASQIQSSEWINPGEVVINEIMWMGSDGDSDDEWIELRNMTDQEIDISNWNIVHGGSGTGGHIEIPNGYSIQANGYFLITKKKYNETDVKLDSDLDKDEGYTHVGGMSLLNSGESLILEDKSNQVIDTAWKYADWPAGTNDTLKQSMERNDTPGDGTLAGSWHTCVSGNCNDGTYWDTADGNNYGTPGAANLSPVVMNEIMFNPSGGGDKEWVELYNLLENDYDVAGWYFTNSDGDKVVISKDSSDSDKTKVPGKGYLTIYLGKNFLDDKSDTLSFYNDMQTPDNKDDDAREDIFKYKDAAKNEGDSFMRIPDGTGIWVDPEATPGKENKLDSEEIDSFRLLTYDQCFDGKKLKKKNGAEICAPVFLQYLKMIKESDDKKIREETFNDILKMKEEIKKEKLNKILEDTENMLEEQNISSPANGEAPAAAPDPVEIKPEIFPSETENEIKPEMDENQKDVEKKDKPEQELINFELQNSVYVIPAP